MAPYPDGVRVAAMPVADRRTRMGLLALTLVSIVVPVAAHSTPSASLALQPYGDATKLAYECLTSGVAVAGTGRAQFCIDVPDADGQKLVVNVATTPPPLETVRVGR